MAGCIYKKRKLYPISLLASALLPLLVSAVAVQAKPVIAPVVSLLLANNGPFKLPAHNYASGDQPQYHSAGDLDKDGDIDFVVPSNPSDSLNAAPVVFVHLNNGMGSLQASAIIIDVDADSEHTHIADINKDGWNDILVSHPSQEPTQQGGPPIPTPLFSVILNAGDAGGDGWDGFLAAVAYTSNTGSGRDIVAADFDNDGFQDLAVGSELTETTSNLYIFMNGYDGIGAFDVLNDLQEQTEVFSGGNTTGLDVAVGTDDINGDTFSDLLWTQYAEPGVVQVLLGNGNAANPFGTAPPALVDAYAVHSFPYGGHFVDANGDGTLDILVGGAGDGAQSGDEPPAFSDNVTFLPGNGDGTFDSGNSVTTQTGAYKSRGFVAADFDGDGNTDIASTSPGKDAPPPQLGQDVRILFGDGSGNFNVAEALIYDDYWYARGILAEDIDGDGDEDIIFTNGGTNTASGTDNINILINNIQQQP